MEQHGSGFNRKGFRSFSATGHFKVNGYRIGFTQTEGPDTVNHSNTVPLSNLLRNRFRSVDYKSEVILNQISDRGNGYFQIINALIG